LGGCDADCQEEGGEADGLAHAGLLSGLGPCCEIELPMVDRRRPGNLQEMLPAGSAAIIDRCGGEFVPENVRGAPLPPYF
jgi:hypothetical protein